MASNLFLHELTTAIVIAATPACVWAILTDFARYPEWNPFITSIAGRVATGARLAVTLEPAGGKATRFAPTVLSALPRRELRWLGRLPVPGLFAGEHRFALEMRADGTVRLTQSERFTGLLVGLMWKSLEGGTRRGFEAMNAALKARAENPRDAARVPTTV